MFGECLAIYPFKEYSKPFHPTSRRLLLLSPEDSLPNKHSLLEISLFNFMCSLSKGSDPSNNSRNYIHLIRFVKVQFSMTKIHLSTEKIVKKLNQQEIESSVSHLSVCHRTVATFVSHVSCMTPMWQKVNQTFFSNTVKVCANMLFPTVIPAFPGIPSCSIVIIIITPFPQRQGTGTYAEKYTEASSAGGLVSTLPILFIGYLTLIGAVLRLPLNERKILLTI